MIDQRLILDHFDETEAQLARRGPAAAASLSDLKPLAEQRKKALAELESLRARQNAANKGMAGLDKSSPEFATRRSELGSLSKDAKLAQEKLNEIERGFEPLLARVPNLPDAGVPEGKGDADNKEVHVWGKPPEQPFTV